MTAYEIHATQHATRDLVRTPSVFVDYSYFNKPSGEAKRGKSEFQNDLTYVEQYDFPRLLELDGEFSAFTTPRKNEVEELSRQSENYKPISVLDRAKPTKKKNRLAVKKSRTMHAILELDARKGDDEISNEEYSLAINTHETNVRKMMMVEDAARMLRPGSSSELQTVRESFTRHNVELFSEMDNADFSGIMNTEQTRLHTFNPESSVGRKIKQELAGYFEGKNFEETERPLMDDELLQKMNVAVTRRFSKLLEVVPDTDNSVKYAAEQSRQIIENALVSSGLTEKGWHCEIDDVTAPSTETETQLIKLPRSTNRTAAELRRLIVHEVGVHAERGQNGKETDIYALEVGTANYADVEEGVGVIYECAVAGSLDNPSYHRARDRYIVAGLALGTDGAPRDKRETYELAWRLIAVRLSGEGECTEAIVAQAKELAFTHVDNAFRGTTGTGEGIIYRKLKVYWEGLRKNADFFDENRDAIDEAMNVVSIGKFDHTDDEELNNVNAVIVQKVA